VSDDRRLREGATEIWESRPVHVGNPFDLNGSVWELWHTVRCEEENREETHLAGEVSRLGDDDAIFAAFQELYRKHKQACEFYTDGDEEED